MIDAHSHLEQADFGSDRDEVIEKCRKAGLKAIVTCCARPEDFQLTMDMVGRWEGFVFATAGIHPEFIKDISEKETDDFLEVIKENKGKLCAIGEIGLDFWWVREKSWQERQKEQFAELISFAKELKKPLVIHCREAEEECVGILEQEDARQVLMHMFGANQLAGRIIENSWNVSANAILLRSKKHKKVIRDMPLGQIMLETDAPWLHPSGKGRNDPTSIRAVAERIAEIKKLGFEEVWRQCGVNAAGFFRLPVEI
jgi:TatD DNase family protein